MINRLKPFITKYCWKLNAIRTMFQTLYEDYIVPMNIKKYGTIGKYSVVERPVKITDISKVYLDDYVQIRRGFILINYTGHFTLKKYSVISINCTVVTGNHKPTVGIPQIISGSNHINDEETNVVVEEGVWIGVNCTLLAGTHVGRGAIIGACSLVNKDIPPYAVAVGSPTKIIASVFTIGQIIEHEKLLYSESERFSRETLENIFSEHFKGKPTIGKTELNCDDKRRATELLHSLKMNKSIYN